MAQKSTKKGTKAGLDPERLALAQAIGQRLKRFREDAGLKQEDIVRAVGISRGTISSWENGHALPDIEKLPETARQLKRTIDEILTGELPMPQVVSVGGKGSRYDDDPWPHITALHLRLQHWVQVAKQLHPELANHSEPRYPPIQKRKGKHQ